MKPRPSKVCRGVILLENSPLESAAVETQGAADVPRRNRFSTLDIAPALRVAFAVVMVLLQVVTCYLIVRFLASSAAVVYAALELVAGMATVALMGGSRDANYRYAWVVMVLLLGVFGLLLYLLWGRGGIRNPLGKRLARVAELPLTDAVAPENQRILDELARQEPHGRRVARYLRGQGFAVYRHTSARYFPLGEMAFDAMIEDIERAERFVYLEFFMVFEGEVWDRVLEALTRKAAQGVDIRLIYDDMGSITTTSHSFLRGLRQAGIRVQVFNPVHRYIYQLYLNFRDHRKILAIDGRVAYTGGINLGDEYANLYPKHGHWKDTAIRLSGPGARSLTECFLRMWHAVEGSELEPLSVRPEEHLEAEGFVVPYVDSPNNNPENPSENVYLEMIAGARESLYVTTPYLIIDDQMVLALCRAARSGVDLRVVIPAVPDHWYVHLTSQSVYGELLRAGVRVYEYTPGFIHAKMMVADRTQAVVGSINMDYRSFNLQHESAVWCCGGDLPETVFRDIEAVMEVSREVELAEWENRSWYVKAVQPVLRIFAPLM